MTTKAQQEKYNYNSFERLSAFKQACLDNDIIFLDGNSVTVDNVVIGGCPMWYHVADIDKWRSFMNDGHYIMEGLDILLPYGLKRTRLFDTNKYYDEQVEKLLSLRNLDVFVSHVLPIKPDSLIDDRYPDSEFEVYYHSNNIESLKATGAKHCIFGHTHTVKSFEQSGIHFHASAIGYPNEHLGSSIEILEIT